MVAASSRAQTSVKDVRRRVVVLMGTRPEAVKLAPVVAALERVPTAFDVRVVVTGQHREMLDAVLRVFGIVPHVDLNLMERWAGRVPSLAEITSTALLALNDVLAKEAPDMVLVQGDTATAFSGCLAAFYARLPVAHVEAGLRTHNPYDPFPEEGNRRLIAALSALHLAPTPHARDNLLREGIAGESIAVTGNTAVDALTAVQGSAVFREVAAPEEVRDLLTGTTGGASSATHGAASRPPRRMLLVTLHRRESWGEPMAEVCRALVDVLRETEDLALVCSVHRNPLVQDVVRRELGAHPRACLLEHVDYLTFLRLMEMSYLIITDSGGIQEEAPSFGRPLLVARKTTERVEGIEGGVAELIGTDRQSVHAAVTRLVNDHDSYRAMANRANPYGDGRASERIVDVLLDYWGHSREKRPGDPLPRWASPIA
jgi:UDP-N-acetylglucosamine 2-epimerase (non-hydrolysing)